MSAVAEVLMPRPKIEDCREAAIDRLVTEVVQWCEGDTSAEDVKHSLLKAIHHWHMDGYEIAKSLERQGFYGINAELIEILESYDSYRSDEHDKAVRKWAAWHGIKPRFSVGDEVRVKADGKERVGFVARIADDLAQYTIRIPELGHVSEGIGTHGFIFKFEDVEGELTK